MIPFNIDDLTPAEEQLVWALYTKQHARAGLNPRSRVPKSYPLLLIFAAIAAISFLINASRGAASYRHLLARS
nr:hypothetical protein [Candidatus Sigynarchaeum springense]